MSGLVLFSSSSHSLTLQSATSESKCSPWRLCWSPPLHGFLQRSSEEGLKIVQESNISNSEVNCVGVVVGKACLSCGLKVPHFVSNNF